MHEASDEEAENTHRGRLRREDQTAQRSVGDAEDITDSWRLRSEDQTARRLAAEIQKSCQAPPAPAPPLGSRVTRSQGIPSASVSNGSG